MIPPCVCRYHIAKDRRPQCLKTSHGACLPCQQLEEMDHEISRTQKSLLELIDQRNQLLVTVNEEHDLLINRLPVELSVRIFELVVPRVIWGRKSEPPDNSFERPENLIIGAICHRWREIAWLSPTLWNHLSLNLHEGSTSTLVLLAQDWLKRSKSLPLFLRFHCDFSTRIGETSGSDSDEKSGHPIAHALHTLLERFLHRAEELSLYAPANSISEISKNLSFPHTESQISRLLIHAVDNNDFGVFRLGNHFVSPLTLDLSFILPNNIDLDWTRLVEFQGSYLEVGESLDVLMNAPNLTLCSFIPLFNDFKPITTHRYFHYTISRLTISNLSDFWSTVALPHLEFLRVDVAEIALKPIEEFISSSGCNITTLELVSLKEEIVDEDIISLLHQIPSLQTLTFEKSDIGELVLNHFGKDDDRFLPNLTDFNYHGGRFTFPWASVATMLCADSRADQNSENPDESPPIPTFRPLRNVNFTFGVTDLDNLLPIDLPIFLKFEGLINSGVSLNIHDERGRDFIGLSKHSYGSGRL